MDVVDQSARFRSHLSLSIQAYTCFTYVYARFIRASDLSALAGSEDAAAAVPDSTYILSNGEIGVGKNYAREYTCLYGRVSYTNTYTHIGVSEKKIGVGGGRRRTGRYNNGPTRNGQAHYINYYSCARAHIHVCVYV